MRRFLTFVLLLAALGAAGLLWVTRPESIDAAALPDHQLDAQAGALVYAAGGCNSCHAAPGAEGADKDVLAGGMRLNSDFGTFVVPNISPDPEHGIGGWTEAQFVSAMMKGTSPEGAHYYPAFPYTSYARMRVEDVLDLHAYLKTLPASDAPGAPHELGFPFGFRFGIGLWKALHLDPAPVLAEAPTELVARGRYLVEGPGHCGECHTPRDATGGLITDAWLGGAPNPEGEGRIPNITSHEDGLGWSESDIAYFLETGFTPDFDSAGGNMVRVIENLAKLPAEDRTAIAAYLKAIPPVPPEGEG